MDNKSVSRQIIEGVWQKNDWSTAEKYISPRWMNHDPQLPDMGRGPAAFRAGIEVYKSAFPDARLTIEQQLAEGNLVCTLWRAIGTNTGNFQGMNPTNKKVEILGTTIDRYEGGQIVESWELYDALGMLQQLGFVPKTPEPPQPSRTQQPRAK